MMATPDQKDPPRNIEEQYSSATHTSDLKVNLREGAPRRPVDLIIAAGWSRSRLGSALLRLHSDWDGAEKPERPGEAAIEALAATYRVEPPRHPHAGLVREEVKGEVRYRLPLDLAREQAGRWFLHEQKLLMQKLKTLPSVRWQLLLFCVRKEIGESRHRGVWYSAEDKIAAVLSWWLDNTCRACEGRRWKLVPGTARSSGKVCEECGGSGKADRPCGPDGGEIYQYIKDCLQAARSDMRGRFQHQKPKGEG